MFLRGPGFHANYGRTVIVHANKDRKIINEHIREGLKKEGVIADNGLKLDCLISKNLTDAEHKVLSSYKTGDVIKLAKNYYRVAEIDYDSKSLLLKDEKNNTKLFYPDKYAKKYNYGVYEKTKAELAVGDSIRLTKTDKERSLYANFEYKVTGFNENKITLRKSGTISKQADADVTLNPKELSDAHWDYAYTVTGYGIQGGSKPYVIDFEPSYRKNLANQRSFYIAVSRAIKHLTIYTDNKAKLLQRIIVNKGDKFSSLEVIGEIKTTKNSRQTAKKAQQHAAKINKNNEIKHKDYERYDAKAIEKLINNQAEFFVKRILGEPNQKISSQTEWRYGNKGSLVVSMAGDKRGLWYNFETGEFGNLLTLIHKETGLPFKDTLKYVSNMFGNMHLLSDINHTKSSSRAETQKSNILEKERANNTSKYANKLYKESLPIAGTVVEKYLKDTRGINNIDVSDLRYHPSVYIGKNAKSKDMYAPAMLAIGRDKNNNLQCVQATYLDPKTAAKANLDIKKRTYSSPSGASVSLSKNDISAQNSKKNGNEITYIAEGVETGLSIKDAIKDANVLVTLGKSNFATVELDKLTNKVMFCLDNDGANAFKDPMIHKAIQRLVDHGKEVFISMPEQINNRKTDFNDSLMLKGINVIKQQINNALPHDQFAKNQISIANSSSDLSKNIQHKSGKHEQIISQSTSKSNAEPRVNQNPKSTDSEIKRLPTRQCEMEI